VDCCQNQEKLQEAWDTCEQGLRLFPEDVELRFQKGNLLQRLGRFAEAVQAYRSLFQANGERYFSSRQRGLTGFLARQNLATAYTEMGDLVSAEEQWRLVVQEMPRYALGWRGLGETLLSQGKEDDAAALGERLLKENGLRGEGLLLRGRVGAARSDMAGARRDFEQAVKACPDDIEIFDARCRFLFEHADPEETKRALEELIRRVPQDAAAHHNLGTINLRLGDYSAAIKCYRRSLELRPNAPGTYLQLAEALRGAGRMDEAIEAWEQTLRLAPGDPQTTKALREAGANA
jgi:tetratricopeptide (TPR) repeat protein